MNATIIHNVNISRVLRGLFGAFLFVLCAMLAQYFFFRSSDAANIALQYGAFGILLLAGIVGLFRSSFRWYAIGALPFCALLLVPVLFIFVNLLVTGDVMRS